MNRFDRMVREWEAASAIHNLPAGLDAEAAIHENLTPEQRRYVSGFLERWEALEAEEEAERQAYAAAEEEAFARAAESYVPAGGLAL